MRTTSESKEERGKIAVMTILLSAACFISYYWHAVLGTGTVFTHLFYIPIILASLWWKRKGIGVALFLAAWLILSHLYIREHVGSINDYLRSVMFIGISGAVAILSERIDKTSGALRERTHELGERVKELSLFYGISNISGKPGISLEEILQETINIIPLSWKYPDIACARIILEDREFSTENFRETIWKQASDIVVHGAPIGALEVYYLEERWESDEGSFLKEESTLLNAIAGRLGGIIERMRAEEALRESESKYRTLLGNLPQKIFLKDRDSVYVSCNEQYAQDLGISPHEIAGKTDYDFHPKELAEKYRANDKEIIESGNTVDIEEGYLHEEKERFVHTIKTPVRDPEGNTIGVLGIFWDITEWKASEEALRESEARLRTILDHLQIGIAIIDAKTHEIIDVNPKAASMVGAPKEHIIGRICHKYICPAEEGQCPITDLGQKMDNSERELIKENGEVIPVLKTVVPITLSGLPCLVDAFIDITERKALESQLVQEQKLASIGQLAAGIAHEINTPIQYVGDNTRFFQESFTDLFNLLEKYHHLLETTKAESVPPELVAEMETAVAEADVAFLSEEIPTAIEQSLEGIDRVTKIVQAMRAFAHPGVSEKTPIELNKAIESTTTVAHNEWKYVAEMEMDFDADLPLVSCLPGEFNQVILNIVLNAACAIADVVGDGSKGKGTIAIGTRREGDWAEIRIRDTGTGIPEAVRSKIFDPFFTTKEVGKGTGQGLAISHNVVVEKLGGTITFETEVGKGTTFVIRLPIGNESTMEGNER